MKSKGDEKGEKGREQQLTGEELAKRIHVQTISTHDDIDPWISIGVGPWTFGTSE